jgi:hypothetical protein
MIFPIFLSKWVGDHPFGSKNGRSPINSKLYGYTYIIITIYITLDYKFPYIYINVVTRYINIKLYIN